MFGIRRLRLIKFGNDTTHTIAGTMFILLQSIKCMNTAAEKFNEELKSHSDCNMKYCARTAKSIIVHYSSLNEVFGPLLMVEYLFAIVCITSTCFYGTGLINSYVGHKFQV